MSDKGNFNQAYVQENTKKSAADAGHDVSNKSFQSNKPSYSTEDNMKDSVNPVMDVLSADIVTKPFCIAAGAAKDPNAKFNPFRKKSGLLNVLAKQAKVWSVI